MAARPETLYDDDFYAWTRDQATALRRLADVDLALEVLYRRARRNADLGLADHGEPDAAAALPHACPCALDQLLQDDCYPANRHGLNS